MQNVYKQCRLSSFCVSFTDILHVKQNSAAAVEKLLLNFSITSVDIGDEDKLSVVLLLYLNEILL